MTPINFDNFSYVMSIKTTLANDGSQQQNLHYGSYRLFFYKQHFYKQHQAEIGIKSIKS